jgi:hypothetical protein
MENEKTFESLIEHIKNCDVRNELTIDGSDNENGFDCVYVRYNNQESVLNEEYYTIYIKNNRYCLLLTDNKQVTDSSVYPKGVPFVIDIIRDDIEHMELPSSVQDLHRRLQENYEDEDIYDGVIDKIKDIEQENLVHFVFRIGVDEFEVIFDLFNVELMEGNNENSEGSNYYNTFVSDLNLVKRSNHFNFKFKNPDSRYNLY